MPRTLQNLVESSAPQNIAKNRYRMVWTGLGHHHDSHSGTRCIWWQQLLHKSLPRTLCTVLQGKSRCPLYHLHNRRKLSKPSAGQYYTGCTL